MSRFECFVNPKNLKEQQGKTWIPFYPLDILDEPDTRPDAEIMKQLYVNGKAMIGVCGFQPVWLHHKFPIDEIRLRKN
jgi:hypothetical protein